MLQHADKAFPAMDEVLSIFERTMQDHRAFFEDEAYGRLVAYGKEILHRHFQDFEEEWSRVATIERRVKAEIDGVPAHGFIDKIEFDHYRATIVDYKTGTIKGKEQRFLPPGHQAADSSFVRQFGGNYWRQAVFYYLLLKHDHSNKWHPSKVVFEYLEPETKSDKRVEIQPGREEEEAVKTQIRQAWETIGARKFDTGCGDPRCHWCRFVTENNYPARSAGAQDNATVYRGV
jgi:DNA helicase-2/ATP-dependent DNA helicase PcrA